jgi:hypothetical protein
MDRLFKVANAFSAQIRRADAGYRFEAGDDEGAVTR